MNLCRSLLTGRHRTSPNFAAKNDEREFFYFAIINATGKE